MSCEEDRDGWSLIGGVMLDEAFQLEVAAFTFLYLTTLPLLIVVNDLQGWFWDDPTSIFERAPRAFMVWVRPATVLLARTAELPFLVPSAWFSPTVGVVLMVRAIVLFRQQPRRYHRAGH